MWLNYFICLFPLKCEFLGLTVFPTNHKRPTSERRQKLNICRPVDLLCPGRRVPLPVGTMAKRESKDL